jgi:hypothetical protein
MDRYIHEIDGSLYSTAELLAKIFNGFNEEINFLAKDSNFTYIEDIEMQTNTYNLYCIMEDDTRLASKIFLTFQSQKTIFGNKKFMVTINMSHDQNQFPHMIYKKLHSIIKKKVKNIKRLPEFKGKIKSIKV